MARVEISKLTDESRIWVFGISPALDGEAASRVLDSVDEFLSTWSAHGAPIVSARDLLHGSFLVVAVDRQSETSGCSIDRMFGLLQKLERELAVRILDADRVFYRGGDGAVQVVSRGQFRDRGDAQSIVFDTNVERIGDVRSGRWERAAAETWHRALLR